MKLITILLLSLVLAVGIFAHSSCTDAAPKLGPVLSDVSRPNHPAPVPNHPMPYPHLPVGLHSFIPEWRLFPTMTAGGPVVHDPPTEDPDHRIFPTGKPVETRRKTSPVTTLPPLAAKPAWTKVPLEQAYTQVTIVFFPRGERTAFTTLYAVDGRRINITYCDVKWHLPKNQTGAIDFAPTLSDDSQDVPGDLRLGADPGQPLKIYGSRTGTDGTATAVITFVGVEMPVPRANDPTGL